MIITAKDRTEHAAKGLRRCLDFCDKAMALLDHGDTEWRDYDERLLLSLWSKAVFYRREYEDSLRIDEAAL